MLTRRTKAGLLITLLIFISVAAGFTMGIILSSVVAKKKEDPAFWKKAAMKQLERLHPTEEQRKKFEGHTDQAVGELAALRQEGIKDVWEIVGRAVDGVQQELTPEQREKFEKIKPKPPEALRKP